MSDKINLFGRSQELIGDGKSDIVLKTKGKVRILIGSKFIDLYDGNKIKGEDFEFIFTGSEVGSKEGIWILDNNEIWIKQKNSDPINIKSESAYVSYIEEQKDITAELKLQALKNIGFFYDTYDKLDPSLNGIFYVISDKLLYIVSNGNISPFTINSSNITEESNNLELDSEKEEIDLSYITYDGTTVTINDKFLIGKFNIKSPIDFICNNISSENGNYTRGFQLTYKNGKSILSVDSLNVRDGLPLEIYPEFWISEVNIINKMSEFNDDEELEELIIKYTIELNNISTFKEGDIIGFYLDQGKLNNYDDEELIEVEESEELNENIQTLITFTVIEKNTDNTIIVLLNNTELPYFDINLIKNKIIFLLKRDDTSYIKISNKGFDISDGENTYSRFGDLSDLELDSIEGSGIYSEQLYANKAAYTKDYELPDDDNSSNFASTEWVKKITGVSNENFMPKGAIIMYHGDSIPEGWNICDGTNGTPNLTGKFIVADNIENENEIELNNDTEIMKTSIKTYSLVFIMKII